jgi:hypothetical protein
MEVRSCEILRKFRKGQQKLWICYQKNVSIFFLKRCEGGIWFKIFQPLKDIAEYQHLINLYDVSHSWLDFNLILQCQFFKRKVKRLNVYVHLETYALTLIFKDQGVNEKEITYGIYKKKPVSSLSLLFWFCGYSCLLNYPIVIKVTDHILL